MLSGCFHCKGWRFQSIVAGSSTKLLLDSILHNQMNHGNKRRASLWVGVKGHAHVGDHMTNPFLSMWRKDGHQKHS